MSAVKEEKIGFYGGTFDPIHHGHIHLALMLKEAHDLSEILFCPTSVNPLKLDKERPIALKDRMKMVELAIKEIPFFRLIYDEAKEDGPKFTFDTLQKLKKTHNNLFLLLGDDTLEEFMKWHRYQEILKMVPILVGTRLKNGVRHFQDPLLNAAIKKGMTPIPSLEISATEIRKRLKEGLYCKHLVPSNVIDYISSNCLYF